jgi:cysteine sulfinate desulfinase/cysteine desulfurase-like protein
MTEIAYFDYNAINPPRPVVADAMMEVLRIAGNASAVHGSGRAARAREDAETVPVIKTRIINLKLLEEMLAASNEPAQVAVMLANNETGIIQPIAEVSSIAHRHGAPVHCDAVQAVGKIPVDVVALGADIAFTATRVSLGRRTRPEDLDKFVAAWGKLYNRVGWKAG